MDADGEMYEIGTKEGRLIQKYSRNKFVICEETFISQEEIPDFIISLRECVRNSSITGGQVFKRFNCKEKCLSTNMAVIGMGYSVIRNVMIVCIILVYKW